MSVSDEEVERVLVVPREVVPDMASWYGLRADRIDDLLLVVV